MSPALRVFCVGLACASATRAQTAGKPDPFALTKAPPAANAVGTTEVTTEATRPVGERSLERVAGSVANLTFYSAASNGPRDVVALRGLVNVPQAAATSAVTVMLDDLPLSGPLAYPTFLLGFEQGALRRGPQGASLAAGGHAGALLSHSAELATAVAAGGVSGSTDGELRVSAGNYGAIAGAFSAGVARHEQGDVAVWGLGSRRDGYVRNTTLGTRLDERETQTGGARFRLRPSATSELTLQLLGERNRDGAAPLVPLGGSPTEVARPREGQVTRDLFGAALKGAFEVPFGRLTSVTSRTEAALRPQTSTLALPIVVDSRIDEAQRAWSQELRLNSGPQSLVTWQGGIWFSDTHTGADVVRSSMASVAGYGEAFAYRHDTETSALFLEATVPPNIGWTVTAGLRLETSRQDFARLPRTPLVAPFAAERSFQSFQPKLAATYAITNNTTLAASLALSSKPGGWSAYTANVAAAAYRPEHTATVAGGIDTALTDRRLALAARVFATAIRDYQFERTFGFIDRRVLNAPRARSLGGEIEATLTPNDEWTLKASLGIVHATLRRGSDPLTGQSLSGNRAPYAPAYDAQLGVTYRAASGWFAGAELAAVGKTFFDATEDPALAIGSRALLHARFGYDAKRWRLTIFGENLGDQGYFATILPETRHGVAGAPRTLGAEAVWKW